jgi:hypothetical protein
MHFTIIKTTNSCLLKFEAVDLEANLSSKSFRLRCDPMHIYVDTCKNLFISALEGAHPGR